MTRHEAFATIASALNEVHGTTEFTAELIETLASASTRTFAVARLILLEQGKSPEEVHQSLLAVSPLLDSLRAWGLRETANPVPRLLQETGTPAEVRAISIGMLGLA